MHKIMTNGCEIYFFFFFLRLSDTPDVPQSMLNDHIVARSDSGPKTNTDISECSTNTDEYVTCTDNSKRVPGMKTPTTASSSTSTQVPGLMKFEFNDWWWFECSFIILYT